MQADLLKFKIEDRKTMKRHRIRKEEIQMKESNYKNYDELPLFLNAATGGRIGHTRRAATEIRYNSRSVGMVSHFCRSGKAKAVFKDCAKGIFLPKNRKNDRYC